MTTSRTSERLLAQARPNAAGYVAGALLMVGMSVAMVALMHLVGLAVDELTRRRLPPSALAWLGVAMFGCLYTQAVARYAAVEILMRTGQRIETRLREEVVAHLQALAPARFMRRKVGEMLAVATHEVGATKSLMVSGFMCFFDALVGLAPLAAMAFTVSGRLTMLAVLPLVCVPPTAYFVLRRIYAAQVELQQAYGAMSGQLREDIANLHLVKSLAIEDRQSARFADVLTRFRRAHDGLQRYQALLFPISGFLSGLSFVIGLGYGGRMVIAGEITIGQFVAFNQFLALLIGPLFAIALLGSMFQRSAAAFARIDEVCETPATPPAPVTTSPAPTCARLAVRSLRFGFHADRAPVLDGIDLDLEPGRILGLLGRTGSGKSTLAKLLVRLEECDCGEITVDGVPVTAWDAGMLRAHVGYSPQDVVVFSMSLAENIDFGPIAASEVEIREAVKVAGLEPFVSSLPEGLQTRLGVEGVALSGGQRRRLGLARTVLQRTPILVLDEPFSGLDGETASDVMTRIRPFLTARATLLLSQSPASLRHADEVLVLEQGRIVERGTPEALASQGGPFAALAEQERERVTHEAPR